MHELGTIGMLSRHDLVDLERANQLALDAGTLSTAAVINLQLAAAYIYSFRAAAALRLCATFS
jgi:hypothetical protein